MSTRVSTSADGGSGTAPTRSKDLRTPGRTAKSTAGRSVDFTRTVSRGVLPEESRWWRRMESGGVRLQ